MYLSLTPLGSPAHGDRLNNPSFSRMPPRLGLRRDTRPLQGLSASTMDLRRLRWGLRDKERRSYVEQLAAQFTPTFAAGTQ